MIFVGVNDVWWHAPCAVGLSCEEIRRGPADPPSFRLTRRPQAASRLDQSGSTIFPFQGKGAPTTPRRLLSRMAN